MTKSHYTMAKDPFFAFNPTTDIVSAYTKGLGKLAGLHCDSDIQVKSFKPSYHTFQITTLR